MAQTWTDFRGASWRVVTSTQRLQFSYPGHAALRAHVFHRDGYKCRRCDEPATDIPEAYTGREALLTAKRDGGGWLVPLVLDHILTMKAGGRNVVDNLQALCEQCNKSKQTEDIAAARAYRERQA